MARPADADVPLNAAQDNVTAQQRANMRDNEDKPEQRATQETAPLNEAPEQKSESAEPADSKSVVTSGIADPKRSVSDAASGTRLARAMDDARAVSDLSALHETAETSKLLDRASGLLKQGDISAARLVLALAHELGSPRAAFMLAQTYDPQVLSTWRALGTEGDPRKARELYAEAYAGGIAEAKARSDALSE